MSDPKRMIWITAVFIAVAVAFLTLSFFTPNSSFISPHIYAFFSGMSTYGAFDAYTHYQTLTQ